MDQLELTHTICAKCSLRAHTTGLVGPDWVDAVEKVADEMLWNRNAQRSNQAADSLNQRCAFQADLESIFPWRTHQNPFSTASVTNGKSQVEHFRSVLAPAAVMA
jgi:hypothetical protein